MYSDDTAHMHTSIAHKQQRCKTKLMHIKFKFLQTGNQTKRRQDKTIVLTRKFTNIIFTRIEPSKTVKLSKCLARLRSKISHTRSESILKIQLLS